MAPFAMLLLVAPGLLLAVAERPQHLQEYAGEASGHSIRHRSSSTAASQHQQQQQRAQRASKLEKTTRASRRHHLKGPQGSWLNTLSMGLLGGDGEKAKGAAAAPPTQKRHRDLRFAKAAKQPANQGKAAFDEVATKVNQVKPSKEQKTAVAPPPMQKSEKQEKKEEEKEEEAKKDAEQPPPAAKAGSEGATLYSAAEGASAKMKSAVSGVSKSLASIKSDMKTVKGKLHEQKQVVQQLATTMQAADDAEQEWEKGTFKQLETSELWRHTPLMLKSGSKVNEVRLLQFEQLLADQAAKDKSQTDDKQSQTKDAQDKGQSGGAAQSQNVDGDAQAQNGTQDSQVQVGEPPLAPASSGDAPLLAAAPP